MLNKLRITACALSALALAFVCGCEAPPRPIPHVLADDSYDQVISGPNNSWTVQYGYKCRTEIDAEGTVHIYGQAYRANNNSYFPDVKLSGRGKFVVHTCDNVKVEEGATATLHGCTTVKAMPGSIVHAHNCTRVRAADGANVQAHGITNVERVAMPDQKKPAAQEPSTN